jgi:hypothetical protein
VPSFRTKTCGNSGGSGGSGTSSGSGGSGATCGAGGGLGATCPRETPAPATNNARANIETEKKPASHFLPFNFHLPTPWIPDFHLFDPFPAA